jgi:hypothetical protein
MARAMLSSQGSAQVLVASVIITVKVSISIVVEMNKPVCLLILMVSSIVAFLSQLGGVPFDDRQFEYIGCVNADIERKAPFSMC